MLPKWLSKSMMLILENQAVLHKRMKQLLTHKFDNNKITDVKKELSGRCAAQFFVIKV
jgi:hypothetical protein